MGMKPAQVARRVAAYLVVLTAFLVIASLLAGAVVSAWQAFPKGEPTQRSRPLALINGNAGSSPPPFVAQPIVYPANRAPILGDGSNAQGGIPPAEAYEPADIPNNFDDSVGGPYVTNSAIEFTSIPPAFQAKMRTLCGPGPVKFVDPLLFPGQSGMSHLHQFFGNTGVTENTTYASLRTTGEGTCGGGRMNRSGYWAPAMIDANAGGPGIARVVTPHDIVVYYLEDHPEDSAKLTRPYRGQNYITGNNPSTGEAFQPVKDAIALANATPGHDRTYTYGNNGFTGWECVGGTITAYAPNQSSVYQPYLRDAAGHSVFNCPAGSTLYATYDGLQCWDGVNLSSPDGRRHMAPLITMTVSGNSTAVCPDGWYRIPQLIVRIGWKVNGDADMSDWYVSSDKPMEGHHHQTLTFLPGESMHMDWFGGWSYGTPANPGAMLTWLTQCVGLTVPGMTSTPHDCDYSTISATKRLKVEEYAILGPTNTDGRARYQPIPGRLATRPQSGYRRSTGRVH